MMQYPVDASNHAHFDPPIKHFGNKCEVNKESFGLWPLCRLTNSYKGFYGEDRKVEHCICLGTQKASPILFRRVAQRKRGTNIVIQQNTYLLVTLPFIYNARINDL